jgi:hypothetical protein
MQTTPRKLVTIITEGILEKELVALFETLKLTGYTITDARGRGSRGVRDAGWDMGANIRIEIVCDEQHSTALAQHLKDNYYADYAMISFTSDVEVLRPEKF